MERRGPSTSQFCCNTGFEIMNLFQCNWSQHGFHIYLFVILSLETWWTQKTVTTWNKLCRNTQTHTHTLNIYQLPQFSTCVTIHSYLHLMWQLSLWFQRTLLPSLHNNIQATIPLIRPSTSKLKDFFQSIYHIYCSI